MARHKKSQALEEDEPSLDISSLIDVCFLLLIYFIVTTTIKAKETDTNMQLPAMEPSDDIPVIKPLFIKVASDGIIFLNTGPAQEQLDSEPENRKLPLLESRLGDYADQARAIGQDPLVQVFVDGDAKHQRAIDVIDVLRKKGITKVTFTDLINQ